MWDQLWIQLWTVGRVWKNIGKHDGESPSHLEQTVRNLDYKDAAGKGSEGSEEDVIGNRRKGDPCYIVGES